MDGAKHEALMGPIDARQGEFEHIFILAQLDPSRPVAKPNGHRVIEQELVDTLFDLVHIPGRCGGVEAVGEIPAIFFLELQRGHSPPLLCVDEGYAATSLARAGPSLLFHSVPTSTEYICFVRRWHEGLDLGHNSFGDLANLPFREGEFDVMPCSRVSIAFGLSLLGEFFRLLGVLDGVVDGVLDVVVLFLKEKKEVPVRYRKRAQCLHLRFREVNLRSYRLGHCFLISYAVAQLQTCN